MADEKKVRIDVDSAELAGKKIGEEIGKGITGSLDKLDSTTLQKKVDSAFSFGGIRDNFSKAIKSGLSESKKGMAQHDKMTGILKKNAELTKSFTNAIAGGGSATEIISSGMKLAGNSLKGMVANINPITVAIQAAMKFLEYYQKTLEQSAKFITQGSLFTDKATMQMMQRTGQSAAGAQGTQRGLDRLGITFEDLQRGLVTDAQVKMFEKIRKEETARLQAIQDVGGPVFEAMQYAAVEIAGAQQKITDAITMVFAKSKGVETFAKELMKGAYLVGEVVSIAIDVIAPIINIAAQVASVVMKVVNVIMNVVKKALSSIQPFINEINNYINAVFSLMEPIMTVLEVIFDIIGEILTASPLMDALTKVIQKLVEWITVLSEWITKMSIKALKSLKGIWDGVMSFINNALNIIPKAFHDMIRGLVKTVTFGAKDIGEYKGKEFNIGSGVSNTIDRAINNLEGDTTNNIYDNSVINNGNKNANENLFANMYTIVNN